MDTVAQAPNGGGRDRVAPAWHAPRVRSRGLRVADGGAAATFIARVGRRRWPARPLTRDV